ncbi:DoxX family protein [Marinomonas ostreistagni]|uniref:DoxX family protein n=1 Tax=Marinomonas ostreistagni TaxID=359209 RepID=UPI0019504AFC|nr:DoxX family protein [Marinomonas ostreistagni]MBM6550773.1 DoxX family protein [Marinomonas ostreistagni]
MRHALSARIERLFQTVPESVVLLLTRFALAAVFWLSGQTKIEGFAFNPVADVYEWGWPMLKDSTVFLFEYEYALPWIDPTWAAYLATIAEHLLPILLLTGVLCRLAALGIFAMTLVIQIFVYPDAYALHGTWAALALLLMRQGAGVISVDYWLNRRAQKTRP